MPPAKSGLWAFFHAGEKQNSAHYKVYCLGCIETHRPMPGSASNVMDVDSGDEDSAEPLLVAQAWFNTAMGQTTHVRGEKMAMANHVMACPHASAAAKKMAKDVRAGKSTAPKDSDDDEPSRKRKRVEFKHVEKSMEQTQLKVFKGLNIPFSDAQGNRPPAKIQCSHLYQWPRCIPDGNRGVV
ncbi:hypothetical protein B0H10DRAFT_2231836 [Mycena sp. CBHHK59/15]|nr:hypothetical protein B0H10DRAFT_2231836 [Mycena sp. CBHHK59/15]